MTYKIQKEIKIRNEFDDWEYSFTDGECSTVCVSYKVIGANTCKTPLYIPKDCINNFISALEQFK